MSTDPTIVTYAPLIIASVAGIGVFVTVIIFGSKTIFAMGGLFKEVLTLNGNVDKLETAVQENHKELRADNVKLREEFLREIRNSTDRIVETLVNHRHTGKDGEIIFTLPPT